MRASTAVAVAVTAILIAVMIPSATGNEAQQAECMELWLRKQPDLLKRFRRNQIQWLCQRTDEWFEKAMSPDGAATSILTPRQSQYLNKLRECHETECVKSIIKCVGDQCDTSGRPGKRRRRPPPGWVPSTIGGHKRNGSEPDDFLAVDDSLILDESEQRCDERFWLANTCRYILNITKPEEVYPEQFRTRNVDTQTRRRLQERLQNYRAKCDRIRNLLSQSGKKFENIPNCNDAQIMLTAADFVAKCSSVLEAASQSLLKTAWNKITSWFGSSSSKPSKAQDQHDFSVWLDRCRRAKDRLQEKGMTMQSWLSSWTSKLFGRRKRAEPEAVAGEIDDLLTNNAPDVRSKRKEYRMLTDDERQRYHNAIRKLKTEKIDTLSKYDLLVAHHTPQEASGAHWGPAFLPFHREFLKQYELALREVDPTLVLPYWDSSLDEGLPTPKDSILWSENFFGNGEGLVVSGPFANFTTMQELSLAPGTFQLFRSVGASPFGGLFQPDDLATMVAHDAYAQLTACVDPAFELLHGIVHTFVGGYMADIGISPNDPVFFMHHCFIDYIWEEFRQSKQNLQQREADYPPDDQSCSEFHYATNKMNPFSIRNIDGLSNNYTREIYFYEQRPRCSEASPTCGSDNLFCDTRTYRCLSKVVPGGNCTNFDKFDICYKGTCKQNVCVANPTTPSASTTLPATTTTTPVVTTTAVITTTLVETTPATTILPTIATTENPVVVPGTTTTTATISTSTPPTTTKVTMTATTTLPTTKTVTTTTSARSTLPPVVTTTARSTLPPVVTTTLRPTIPTQPPTTRPTVATTTRPTVPPTTRPTATTTTTRPTTSTITQKEPVTGKTTLPTTTTGTIPPTVAPAFPVAFFTVTVVRGVGYYAQAAQNTRSTTVGQNMPRSYTQTLSGTTLGNTTFPGYIGATMMRTYDPSRLSPYNNVVQFTADTLDQRGATCKLQCFNQQQKRYANCTQGNRFKISPNQYVSDPIKFYNNEKDALEKPWTINGNIRQRQPDYILFQCA